MWNDAILKIYLVVAVFWCGCRRQDGLGSLSLVSESDGEVALERSEAFCRNLVGKSQSCRTKDFGTLEAVLLAAPFDEGSYSGRRDSLSAYCRIVDGCCRTLLAALGNDERIWKLRLSLTDRVNAEIERCEHEPKGGPYGDVSKIGMGPFMTQGDFLSRLKRMRFDMVRDGFEESRFSAFFNGLPEERKKTWLWRLEEVARRRVVVWDPQFPDAEMPRYEAEDMREWLPQKSPDEPRRYVEHLGGGRTMVIKETRWGVETRKRREAMRRQRQGESPGKETTCTTNGVVR